MRIYFNHILLHRKEVCCHIWHKLKERSFVQSRQPACQVLISRRGVSVQELMMHITSSTNWGKCLRLQMTLYLKYSGRKVCKGAAYILKKSPIWSATCVFYWLWEQLDNLQQVKMNRLIDAQKCLPFWLCIVHKCARITTMSSRDRPECELIALHEEDRTLGAKVWCHTKGWKLT